MRRAVEKLSTKPDYLLVDARSLRELSIPQRGIIRGDAQSISIAAASILAKTTRDALMVELDRTYQATVLRVTRAIRWLSTCGALEKLGVCSIHRRTFALCEQRSARCLSNRASFSFSRRATCERPCG